METPEETLLRAIARLDSAGEHGRDDNTDPEDMKKEIQELRNQLQVKAELCSKLQLALTELLARGSHAVNTNATIRHIDLSSEHLSAVLTQFKNQVWFSTKPPKLVDAILTKMSSTITESIMRGERTSALTFEECVEMVDSEVRLKWENEVPAAVSNFLAMEVRVYQSHAAVVTKTDGKLCEPVHFLVYMIRKLHNHVTHFVFNLRKSQEKKLGTGSLHLENLHATNADENEKEERLKWQDNPSYNVEFAAVHEASNKASNCISKMEDCIQALSASVNKLASKPVLSELIRHISSIVSLQKKAASEGWEIPRKKRLATSLKTLTFCTRSPMHSSSDFLSEDVGGLDEVEL